MKKTWQASEPLLKWFPYFFNRCHFLRAPTLAMWRGSLRIKMWAAWTHSATWRWALPSLWMEGTILWAESSSEWPSPRESASVTQEALHPGRCCRTVQSRKQGSWTHSHLCSSWRATRGRNMTKVVQEFLWAQKVQEPVALFSDWLYVGHIDEFMTFVPAPDRKVNIAWRAEPVEQLLRCKCQVIKSHKAADCYWWILTCYYCRTGKVLHLGLACFCMQGFRLLLASPDAAYKLFRSLQSDGHGKAKLFEGEHC